MSDEVAGGVVAPAAEPVAAVPVDTTASATPTPLGSQVPQRADAPEAKPASQPKTEEKKAAVSTREAIQRAMEAQKAKQPDKPELTSAKTEVKPESRPEPKTEGAKPSNQSTQETKPAQAGQEASQTPPEPRRSENGRFEPVPYKDPPSRFSPDAKAAWEQAPEPVRAEVHRLQRELEQGYQKYKGDAEAFNDVREFHELAQKGGTNLKAALQSYTGIENLLRRDPVAGLEEVVRNLGLKGQDGRQLSLRDLAEHVLSQTPEQMHQRQQSTALQSEVIDLRQQLTGMRQFIENTQKQSVESQIDTFAKQNLRFDELAQDIAFFLQSGRAGDLSEAYQLAVRLNPAASGASPAKQVIPAPLEAEPLNPAGSKSISGAPTHGSNPPRGKAPSSNREALQRALARAGA